MTVFWEVFGYIGTALVLMSMMMTSITKLRCINIAGSIISMIYALVACAYPVALLNGGLIIINVVQLIKKNACNVTIQSETSEERK